MTCEQLPPTSVGSVWITVDNSALLGQIILLTRDFVKIIVIVESRLKRELRVR